MPLERDGWKTRGTANLCLTCGMRERDRESKISKRGNQKFRSREREIERHGYIQDGEGT